MSRSIQCRSCPHPPHLGACTKRNGGTAYACACPAQTPSGLWAFWTKVSSRRAVVELVNRNGQVLSMHRVECLPHQDIYEVAYHRAEAEATLKGAQLERFTKEDA
jgi:hypothetical protein